MRAAMTLALLLLTSCGHKPQDEDLDGYTDDVDCDDEDDAIFPGATEVCDEVDNDCSGFIDGPDATDADPYWVDADADGFGDPDRLTKACGWPAGWADNGDDCDDDDEDVNPDAAEITGNGVDDDCDSSTPD